VYLGALLFWLFTRGLVLAHQGSEPWMNAFVVASAHDMLAGNWTEAFVRPPLPAFIVVPMVSVGIDERGTVAVLYILASLFQFGAFALLASQLFPGGRREQVLMLLFFLLLPFNHSIHHYRNSPAVLSSGAIFALSAHWLWSQRSSSAGVWSWRSVGWAAIAIGIGVWTRTEMALFALLLSLLVLALYRSRGLGPFALYGGATIAAVIALAASAQLAGADPRVAEEYRVHTFLDSIPPAWISPACQADLTEDCRVREGTALFGSEHDPRGLLGLVLAQPILALQKTVLSAAENLRTLFAFNLSTYPPVLWPVWAAPLVFAPAWRQLAALPRSAWVAASAALIVSIFPLSWAPPHPQYHLHTVFPVAVLTVPLLGALSRLAFGGGLLGLFWLANAALTAARYTRYTGY
jgi:hypothetical protein